MGQNNKPWHPRLIVFFYETLTLLAQRLSCLLLGVPF